MFLRIYFYTWQKHILNSWWAFLKFNEPAILGSLWSHFRSLQKTSLCVEHQLSGITELINKIHRPFNGLLHLAQQQWPPKNLSRHAEKLLHHKYVRCTIHRVCSSRCFSINLPVAVLDLVAGEAQYNLWDHQKVNAISAVKVWAARFCLLLSNRYQKLLLLKCWGSHPKPWLYLKTMSIHTIRSRPSKSSVVLLRPVSFVKSRVPCFTTIWTLEHKTYVSALIWIKSAKNMT